MSIFYLLKPVSSANRHHIELRINLGSVSKISEGISADLTSVKVPNKPLEDTYQLDNGKSSTFSLTFTRTQPNIVNDSGESEYWSNAKWLTMMRSLINRWQMKTDGVQLYIQPSDPNMFYSLGAHTDGLDDYRGQNCYISRLDYTWDGSAMNAITGSINLAFGGSKMNYSKDCIVVYYLHATGQNGRVYGSMTQQSDVYTTRVGVTDLIEPMPVDWKKQYLKHKFSSWNTSENGSGTTKVIGASVGELTDDLRLYAQWVASNGSEGQSAYVGAVLYYPYLSDNPNGHPSTFTNPACYGENIINGESYKAMANLFDSDDHRYSFLGWITSNTTVPAYAVGDTIATDGENRDVRLYALWKFGNYTGYITINTPEEFCHIGDTTYNPSYTMSAKYVIVKNLDMSDAVFRPIGTYDNPFTGEIDGAGSYIMNIIDSTNVIDNTNGLQLSGIIGVAGQGCKLSNMAILNGRFSVNSIDSNLRACCGVMVAYAKSNIEITNCMLYNCSAVAQNRTDTIGVTGSTIAGGFVGKAIGTVTMSDCMYYAYQPSAYVTASAGYGSLVPTATKLDAGGFIGYAGNASLTRCMLYGADIRTSALSVDGTQNAMNVNTFIAESGTPVSINLTNGYTEEYIWQSPQGLCVVAIEDASSYPASIRNSTAWYMGSMPRGDVADCMLLSKFRGVVKHG